ncbi:hypothetical protein FACS1894180_9190 [Bacteroidia bacterium]|nr:hypothetical protein FACS1894180_9190 [Bacteroidia bacterium]
MLISNNFEQTQEVKLLIIAYIAEKLRTFANSNFYPQFMKKIKLIEARKNKGLSQEQMALALNMDPSCYNRPARKVK